MSASYESSTYNKKQNNLWKLKFLEVYMNTIGIHTTNAVLFLMEF